jgi:uncharacterized repeat protein (TIGR01451 family)
MLVFLVLGLMAAAIRVGAQGMWLHVVTPSGTVGVSNSLSFTISVTNLTGASQMVGVTNITPATAQFVSVSFGTVAYPYTTVGSSVIFNVGPITNGGFAVMGVTIRPTAAGNITNVITVSTNGVLAIVGPVPILVTNPVSVADLSVAITGPASPVFTNDVMVYGVNVTNLGPGTATGVFLTNTLPAGVILKSVSPTNQSASGSNLIFNLGSLASGAFNNFQIIVVPTNVGPLTLSAVVSTNGVIDPNTANNSASTNINIGSFLYGQLIATNLSAMTYDPQTGLMKQTIRLTNIGTNAVAAARVIVSGLTNWLYNAVGTNSGNPYVVYGAPLDTNQSVDLVLEYFVSTRLPIHVDNTNYTAVGVAAVDLSDPGGGTGSFSITSITTLPNGYVLIEFQSLRGSNYTILYSDNPAFTNALAAQPSIVAPANRTQWIDDGPPKTVSATNASSRFYRVRLNP